MFWSIFCDNKKQEVTKPSALMDAEDEQTAITVTDPSCSLSFPLVEHLYQPSNLFSDNDPSIVKQDISEPKLEIEPHFETPGEVMEESLPLAAPSVTQDPLEENMPVVSSDEFENIPMVSKDEFVAILKKLEKENEWFEKRQAKKAGGNKKSRRNNKTKKGKEPCGLKQSSKKARTNNGANSIQPAANPLTLISHN